MLDWRQFEGELVAGQFPLERLLSSDQTGAVFLTRFASGEAIIELKVAGQDQSAALIERWNRTASLQHPHLAGIPATGAAVLGGRPLAYFVTERAEENLATVLRERPLTADEAREMLLPVADALAYLHRQGLVHGDLKPSNVLAIGDTVKISSGTVSPGDPAGDIRSLGATLTEALTQRADAPADSLPLPFREIAANCLHDDPRLQWSADHIAARLRSPESPASSPSKAVSGARSSRRIAALGAAAGGVAIVVAALLMNGKSVTPGVPPAGLAAPHKEPAPEAAAPVPDQPKPAPLAQADRSAEPSRTRLARDGVTRRVLPDVPEKARATVRGTARVEVRVTVDSAGRVVDTRLEPGGSPYFGRLAEAAARQWEFVAAEDASPRYWALRFGITQTGVGVVVRRAGQE